MIATTTTTATATTPATTTTTGHRQKSGDSYAPPPLPQVRGHLKGLRNSLEGVRKKMCIEENQIEANRKQVTEEIVKKVLKSEARRKAFEARWNEVKARNLKALDEGTFDGPIVPIRLRPPAQKKATGLKHEVKIEKASFLKLLDEAPEAPPETQSEWFQWQR